MPHLTVAAILFSFGFSFANSIVVWNPDKYIGSFWQQETVFYCSDVVCGVRSVVHFMTSCIIIIIKGNVS